MVKINMMSGRRNFGEDWIHIDKANFEHIKYHDVEKLPFEDNTVSLIYCSHGIAYFDQEDIVPILEEWKRVLKPQGVLRIATPDFTVIAELCTNKGAWLDSFIGPLYGRMEVGEEIMYHKTCYTYRSLSALLRIVGFRNPERYDFNKTIHSQFDDHSKAHWPHREENIKTGNFTKDQILISLNVECWK